jgi:WD40 repeat protein
MEITYSAVRVIILSKYGIEFPDLKEKSSKDILVFLLKKIKYSAVRIKTIQIWDRVFRSLIKMLGGHSDSVNSDCFSANGNHILSDSWDKIIKIWDRFPYLKSKPPKTFRISKFVCSLLIEIPYSAVRGIKLSKYGIEFRIPNQNDRRTFILSFFTTYSAFRGIKLSERFVSDDIALSRLWNIFYRKG